MAIPAKKLQALVSESKKNRRFGSSADAEDEDQAEDMADEDAGEEEDEEDRGAYAEEKGPTPEQVQTAVDKVDEGGDEEIMDLVDDYNPEEEGNPPSWVTDEGKWEKAKKAVEEKWDEYDDPWAVVAHVYKNMGGKISSKG